MYHVACLQVFLNVLDIFLTAITSLLARPRTVGKLWPYFWAYFTLCLTVLLDCYEAFINRLKWMSIANVNTSTQSINKGLQTMHIVQGIYLKRITLKTSCYND